MDSKIAKKNVNLFIPLIILFIRFVHLSIYLPKPKTANL